MHLMNKTHQLVTDITAGMDQWVWKISSPSRRYGVADERKVLVSFKNFFYAGSQSEVTKRVASQNSSKETESFSIKNQDGPLRATLRLWFALKTLHELHSGEDGVGDLLFW